MKKYIEVIKDSLNRMSKQEEIFMATILGATLLISALVSLALAIIL